MLWVWRRLSALPLSIVGLSLLAGCSSLVSRSPAVTTGAFPHTRATLSSLIPTQMDKAGVVGLSVALVDDQQVAWSQGFGFADKARGIPATSDTVYRTGSIAKLFTALAVMQLEERRKIDIDQGLQAFLPQFSIKSRGAPAGLVTARNVMTHHAGLPCDLSKGMWSSSHLTEVTEQLRNEYLAFPPDYVFAYSNLGYTLLGDMIQQTTGRDFAGYMEDEVLEPMGMEHSSFLLRPKLAPLLSKGYRDGEERALLPMRDLPAASFYTSVADLSRFLMMVLARGTSAGHTIVTPGTMDEMLSPQNLDVPLDFDLRVGLGWFLDKGGIDGAGPVARHGGTTLLFNSQIIVLPRYKLGVAVLSNTSQSRELVARIAEAILTQALEEKAGVRQVSPTPRKPLTAGAADTTQNPRGQYMTELGLIAIAPEQRQLCACNIERTLAVVPLANGWLGVKDQASGSLPGGYRELAGAQITHRTVQGRDVLVLRYGDREQLLGDRVKPRPIPPAWQRRLGNYRVVNQDLDFPVSDVHLRQEQGVLFLCYRMPMLSPHPIEVPIAPVSATEAITMGLGRTRGETVRIVSDGKQERLVYSGYVAQKVAE